MRKSRSFVGRVVYYFIVFILLIGVYKPYALYTPINKIKTIK